MTGQNLRLIGLAAATLVFASSYASHSHSRPAVAVQQAPAGPKNLKVLPVGTTNEQIRGIMRGFTSALGVQCNFCHVPRDFASDANPHKDIARGMLRMTQQLNAKDLPAIPGLMDAKVTCYTCHRGATKPLTEMPAPVAPVVPAAAPSPGAAARP